MPFSIRKATTVDAPVILDAYQWLFDSPGGVPPDWDEVRALDAVVETIESAESVFYVAIATSDSRLVGICSAHMDLNSVRYGRRCWIEDLAVEPPMRSRGIGEALIGQVKNWARTRGATHLELDTGEERTEARRFYERLGPDSRTIAYGWRLAADSP